MSSEVAESIVFGVQMYLWIGAAFAVLFSLFFVGRIDPAARGATWGFRLVIIPGATLLWPWLLGRVIAGDGPPEERSPHRDCSNCPRAKRGVSP